MLPLNHHRMSSSEIERLLYITNSLLHGAFFERKEPFPDTGSGEPDGISKNNQVKLKNEFIETQAQVNLLKGNNIILSKNIVTLTEEVKKLQRELLIDFSLPEKELENTALPTLLKLKT